MRPTRTVLRRIRPRVSTRKDDEPMREVDIDQFANAELESNLDKLHDYLGV